MVAPSCLCGLVGLFEEFRQIVFELLQAGIMFQDGFLIFLKFNNLERFVLLFNEAFVFP